MTTLSDNKDSLIPSATAIILHQTPRQQGFKVLLLKRNSKLATHGGSWVFPGGKFDPEDYQAHDIDPTIRSYNSLTKSERLLIAKTAAFRETKEEASIEISPNELHLCSTWLTPETMKKRFDAFFFITQSASDKVAIDGSEIHDYQWISPLDALANQRDGVISLPPPTYVTLKYLSEYQYADIAINEMTQQATHFKPKLIMTKNGFHSLYEEDSGYQTSELNIQGNTHRLIFENSQFNYLKT